MLQVELFTSDGSRLIIQPLVDAGLLTVEEEEQSVLWEQFSALFHLLQYTVYTVILDIPFLYQSWSMGVTSTSLYIIQTSVSLKLVSETVLCNQAIPSAHYATT
jgi:hypothetical protein